MNKRGAPLVAAKANLTAVGQVKTRRVGRSHNLRGFSNRMLDTTVALMAAK